MTLKSICSRICIIFLDNSTDYFVSQILSKQMNHGYGYIFQQVLHMSMKRRKKKKSIDRWVVDSASKDIIHAVTQDRFRNNIRINLFEKRNSYVRQTTLKRQQLQTRWIYLIRKPFRTKRKCALNCVLYLHSNVRYKKIYKRGGVGLSIMCLSEICHPLPPYNTPDTPLEILSQN